MEEAFESWTTTVSTGTGSYIVPEPTITFMPPPSFISMSMVVKEEWKPEEPVEVKAKPVKRYSKETFKKKLKELCG